MLHCSVACADVEKVSTEAFAQWLARPVAEGGAGCRVALNLSGDLSSGLLTRGPAPGKKGAARPGEIVGPGSYPVPTVLLFTPRR